MEATEDAETGCGLLLAVQRYLDGRDIEIMAGDIAATCGRLEGEDLVLSFVDTDNYTPARAALDVVRERTVPGGAIFFDHFTGTGRFRQTLGSGSPGGRCWMIPAGPACTAPACSTASRFRGRAGEAPARAPAADL